MLVVFIIFVIWLLSGFYSVGTQQQGVVLRFGDYLRTTQPGLHYHLPSPIESVL
jgi:membrane protease subunit HflK